MDLVNEVTQAIANPSVGMATAIGVYKAGEALIKYVAGKTALVKNADLTKEQVVDKAAIDMIDRNTADIKRLSDSVETLTGSLTNEISQRIKYEADFAMANASREVCERALNSLQAEHAALKSRYDTMLSEKDKALSEQFGELLRLRSLLSRYELRMTELRRFIINRGDPDPGGIDANQDGGHN